jgi:hypothetical protein
MLSFRCDRDKDFQPREVSMSDRLVLSPIEESDDAGCAFILETETAMRRCGLPRQPRSSYCREHHALCHLVCGTSAEADRLREVETLARAVGGRQGWHGSEPPQPFLDRLTQAVRGFS